MPPSDLPRLRATLGDPRLARLLAALRRRLELGSPLTGALTLTRATPEERAAADELVGRRPTRGATLTIDLDQLAAMLRDAGICRDLRTAVEALLGPIEDRRAAERERDAAWADLWRETRGALSTRLELHDWIDELERSGTVRRICGDELAMARAALCTVALLAAALPAQAEPLAAIAARLLGDAHALDPGSPAATLAVRAAARLGGVDFEDDAEGRRAAWASVGVMCDELSTPALVLNLPASGISPLAQSLRAAAAAGEPLHVSLRMLLRYPLLGDAALQGADVFICENPTIVALAAERLGTRCAPLLCVNGQFATPVAVLLRQLRAAGARLHYHGDFDPAGLAIARRVLDAGAQPWRFGIVDYKAAPKGVRFAGAAGVTPWDPPLGEAMRDCGCSVHEEALFDSLAEDLARRAHPFL